MFKIMLHKPSMAKGTYGFYTKIVSETNEETGEVTQHTVEFETDSLDELEAEYLKLLSKYTGEQIKVVEDMDVDLIANIKNT